MQTVIDGVLTEYNTFGQKNKNNILILHGWGQSSKNWEYVGQVLSKNYNIFLLDLPGFGGSSIPEAPFNTEDYSNFVNQFIKKIIKGKVILIGHSFGGKIAIKLTSKNPAYIEKLFLISPSGIESRSIITDLKIVLVKIIKVVFFWTPKNIKNTLLQKFGSRDYVNSDKMKGTFIKTVGEMVVNDAKNIRVPTVIIWGENDEEINLKNSKKLKRLINGSILRVIWGQRHSANIESPDKLLSILNDYV